MPDTQPPLIRPIRIGSFQTQGNLMLAPVAGYSDRSFREVCAEYGCHFAFTEMVSAEALVRNSEKTFALAARGDQETDLGIQIFGPGPEVVGPGVEKLLAYEPTVVDLNCGCPVPKIVKNGAGSALMKDPDRLEATVAAMRTALDNAGRTDIPVTVKIRSGWDFNNLNYLEAGLRAVNGGAAMVSIHSRTRSQGYSGTADWSHLKALKEALDVPVCGSGDLFTAEDALRMLTETGCDGVMFARGAMGNPFLFSQTLALAEGRKALPPTPEEKLTLALNHLNKSLHYKGAPLGFKEMKKQLCAYSKGIPGGGELRNALVHTENPDEARAFLAQAIQNLKG